MSRKHVHGDDLLIGPGGETPDGHCSRSESKSVGGGKGEKEVRLEV